LSLGLAAGEPTFSVVVPLYDKERHVERALRSAIAQTLPALEILVVDDGSTDGGAAVVEAIAQEDGRVRLMRQPNGGVSRARNAGITASRGSHVAFLDADDEWKPGYLEEINKLISLFPEAGSYSTSYRIVEAGDREKANRIVFVSHAKLSLIGNYFKAAFHGSPVWTSATTVPRAVLDDVGGFLDGAGRGEDLELWWRIGAKRNMAFSKAELAVYHKDADNRSDEKRHKAAANPSAGEAGKPGRWWGLMRLEAMVADASIPRARRRWMREWIRWFDIISVSGLKDGRLEAKGRGRAISAAFPGYAFFYGLFWVLLTSVRRIRVKVSPPRN
jgi:glycosyltransferase involved in cell wall biosynthesis